MSLNIKKEEPHRLARELAQFAGETMAGVITVALKKRIEREERERSTEERLRRMRAMSKRVSKNYLSPQQVAKVRVVPVENATVTPGIHPHPSLPQQTGEGTFETRFKHVAKSLRPGPSTVEHGDFLYDERGLPA